MRIFVVSIVDNIFKVRERLLITVLLIIFSSGIAQSQTMCVSFQFRKHLSLGRGGFYFLMSIFHFEMKRQLATHFDDYTIDQILLKNLSTENEIWLANKVDKIPDEIIDKFSSKA